jgi:hypothetical protein
MPQRKIRSEPSRSHRYRRALARLGTNSSTSQLDRLTAIARSRDRAIRAVIEPRGGAV